MQFYRQTLTYIIENLNAGVLPRQIEVCHHRNPGGLAALAGDGFHKATVLSPVFPPIVKPTVYQPTKGEHLHKPNFRQLLGNRIECLDREPTQEPYFIPAVLGQAFDNLNCF